MYLFRNHLLFLLLDASVVRLRKCHVYYKKISILQKVMKMKSQYMVEMK